MATLALGRHLAELEDVVTEAGLGGGTEHLVVGMARFLHFPNLL